MKNIPSQVLDFYTKNKKINELYEKFRWNSKVRRIYHYHVRKSGGTSLNKILLNISGGDPNELYKQLYSSIDKRMCAGKYVYVGWNKWFIQRGIYHYAFSHIPAHEIKLPKNTFTVTIIRDPVKRLLSHYRMLLEYKMNEDAPSGMKNEVEWIGDDFKNFLKNIPKEHLLRQLYMFSKSYSVDEAFENITNCSHFFLTENFNAGVNQLGKKIGFNLKAIHTRRNKIPFSMNTKQKKILTSMLEPEIELYDKLRKYSSKM